MFGMFNYAKIHWDPLNLEQQMSEKNEGLWFVNSFFDKMAEIFYQNYLQQS